jgi:hypothetical protein
LKLAFSSQPFHKFPKTASTLQFQNKKRLLLLLKPHHLSFSLLEPCKLQLSYAGPPSSPAQDPPPLHQRSHSLEEPGAYPYSIMVPLKMVSLTSAFPKKFCVRISFSTGTEKGGSGGTSNRWIEWRWEIEKLFSLFNNINNTWNYVCALQQDAQFVWWCSFFFRGAHAIDNAWASCFYRV